MIDGYITEKMSRNPPHDAALNRARRRIERALPTGWIVRIRSAITTADSEPEPDIAVARGDDGDYAARHPGPLDLALVVEVANTTLAADPGPKLAAYARAAVTAYWILNLNESRLEVFTIPNAAAESYEKRESLTAGDSIAIPLDREASQAIAVGDLLPSAVAKARIAADRGDFNGYKQFAALSSKVKTDGVLPDGVTDTEIRAAGARFLRREDSASHDLQSGYDAAIIRLTRAGRVQEAEALQAERDAGGWLPSFAGGPPEKADPYTGNSRDIDLMKYIDARRDAVHGTWAKTESGITSGTEFNARLMVLYQPPEQYDLVVKFRKLSDGDRVGFYLVVRGQQFMVSFTSNTVGLDNLDGQRADANQTTIRVPTVSGRAYTCRVSVRGKNVQVFLDDKRIISYDTNGGDLSINDDWKMSRTDVLGLGSQETPSVFSLLMLREIGGRGKLIASRSN